MRLSKWALAAALAGMLPPSIALAQMGAGVARQRPAEVQRTAYEYSDYYAQDPPAPAAAAADAEAAPAATDEKAAPAADCAAGNGCAEDNGCGDENGCDNGCGADAAPEAWKLVNLPWLEARKINVGGFIAQSYTQNFSSPSDHFNGPVTWTDQSNRWQLNSLWAWIYRDTDTGGYGWDIGGRTDIQYGTDHRFNTEAGLEDKWNRASSTYGVALPSFYLEIAKNDWKAKLGHFISPVGFFTVQTNLNLFNSLPYTFQYGEPFTHLGGLFTYNGIEGWSLGSGFIRGWDNFGNQNPNLGWMGVWTKTWDSGASFAGVHIWSHEPNQNLQFTNRYLQTLVYSRPLTAISDKLTWVAQSDLGIQMNAIAQNGGTARWYGLNQYLIYTKSAQWKWAGGFEWFRDEEGFRVGNLLPSIFGSPAPAAGLGTRVLPLVQGGYAGNFFQSTLGPLWTPTPNVMVRPNLRFDWFSGHQTTFNTSGLRPYDAGRLNHQVLLATDLIISY